MKNTLIICTISLMLFSCTKTSTPPAVVTTPSNFHPPTWIHGKWISHPNTMQSYTFTEDDVKTSGASFKNNYKNWDVQEFILNDKYSFTLLGENIADKQFYGFRLSNDTLYLDRHSTTTPQQIYFKQ